MKHIILSILASFFVFSVSSNNGDNIQSEENNTSLLNSVYFDPGHKQKRSTLIGKDRAPFELYFGSQPSWAIKFNQGLSKGKGSLVERWYIMAGMDFDQDLNIKFGISLNPGKYNQNRALSANNPQTPHRFSFKLWRYVQVRKSIEIGYKTYFLDPEDSLSEKLNHENYGGVTLNYSWAFDGTFLFDSFMWNFLDHRTARRIRFKFDAGVFLNLNTFDQPHLGSWTLGGSNATDEEALNEDIVIDDLGNFAKMPVYPVVSPFFNISIGFALYTRGW